MAANSGQGGSRVGEGPQLEVHAEQHIDCARAPCRPFNPQIGLVFANKRVFYKQRDNHFFPAASYVGSLLLTQLPQSFIEVTVFSLLLYWVRAWGGAGGVAMGAAPALLAQGHRHSIHLVLPLPRLADLGPHPQRRQLLPLLAGAVQHLKL